MSFQFVRDCLRWSRPWVHIAKTLIAGEYVTQMVARLERGVLAVPVHSAGADGYHRTPGSIAISSAGRSSKRRCRCKRTTAPNVMVATTTTPRNRVSKNGLFGFGLKLNITPSLHGWYNQMRATNEERVRCRTLMQQFRRCFSLYWQSCIS